jgi:hypothetical protein
MGNAGFLLDSHVLIWTVDSAFGAYDVSVV